MDCKVSRSRRSSSRAVSRARRASHLQVHLVRVGDVADLVLLLAGSQSGAHGGKKGLSADGPLQQDRLTESAPLLLEAAAAKVFAATRSEKNDGQIGPRLLPVEKLDELPDAVQAEGFFGQQQGTDEGRDRCRALRPRPAGEAW